MISSFCDLYCWYIFYDIISPLTFRHTFISAADITVIYIATDYRVFPHFRIGVCDNVPRMELLLDVESVFHMNIEGIVIDDAETRQCQTFGYSKAEFMSFLGSGRFGE